MAMGPLYLISVHDIPMGNEHEQVLYIRKQVAFLFLHNSAYAQADECFFSLHIFVNHIV